MHLFQVFVLCKMSLDSRNFLCNNWNQLPRSTSLPINWFYRIITTYSWNIAFIREFIGCDKKMEWNSLYLNQLSWRKLWLIGELFQILVENQNFLGRIVNNIDTNAQLIPILLSTKRCKANLDLARRSILIVGPNEISLDPTAAIFVIEVVSIGVHIGENNFIRTYRNDVNLFYISWKLYLLVSNTFTLTNVNLIH